MNRDNVIQGVKIDRHPMSDRVSALGVYLKGATVIAAQAQIAGIVKTPEGDMRYQAGDYIVTDNPPTHAWPVRQQVFEQTYNLSHTLEEGQFPTSEPKVDEEPALSAPPTNVTDIKAQEIGMERAGAEYSLKEPVVTNVGPDDQDQARELAREHAAKVAEQAQVAQGAPKATKGTSGRKSDRHAAIADSASLGLKED